MLFTLMVAMGLFLVAFSHATLTADASVDKLTKMSQLLDDDVVAALDGDGDGLGEITGIDPGAGMMNTLNAFIDGNESWSAKYEVLDSSDATMTVALDNAVQNNDSIVVTLWSPHWAFNKYDLTYLEDDISLYGEADTVVTLARQDLDTDRPDLYDLIERFEWEHEDIQQVMLAIQEGTAEEQAAQDWVDDNTATVETWIGDVDGTGSDPVNLGYVAWAGEIASTNVMKLVLEEAGYDVTLHLVAAAALYEGLANGDIDFTVSAWLPLTQSNYWEDEGYKDQIDWVNVNLENAKVGLVIPTYMAQSGYFEPAESSPGFILPLAAVGLLSIGLIRKHRK